MCSRKCGTGLKRIVALSVLLVLLVGSLSAAWPWAWGKSEPEPPVVEKIVTVYVEKPIPAGMMLLEERLWNELKATLTAREKALADLKTSYEKELKVLNDKIASLTALSPISTEMYNGLMVDLEAKTLESQAYYEQTLASPNKLGGMIGASGLYRFADGKTGAEIEMGIRWDKVVLKVGVGYIPDAWELRLPALNELTGKVGLMYTF